MASRRAPIETATILETSDPGQLGLAKSLLEAADIPYFARGEVLSIAFGGGPVRLQVPEDRAAEAHALLAELTRTKKRSRVLKFPRR